MIMYDFLGNELSIGDYVAFSIAGHTGLTYGIIKDMKISKNNRKSITIKHIESYFKNLNITYRVPANVIKIEKNIVIEKKLCDQ